MKIECRLCSGQSLLLIASIPHKGSSSYFMITFLNTSYLLSPFSPRLPCPLGASEIPVLPQTALLRGRIPEASGLSLEEVRETAALQNKEIVENEIEAKAPKVGSQQGSQISCQRG